LEDLGVTLRVRHLIAPVARQRNDRRASVFATAHTMAKDCR
jgi:hypothetical protein